MVQCLGKGEDSVLIGKQVGDGVFLVSKCEEVCNSIGKQCISTYQAANSAPQY